VRAAGALFAAALALSSAQAESVRTGPGVGETARYSLSVDLIVRDDNQQGTETGALIQTAHVALEGVGVEEDGSLLVRGRFDQLTSVWRRDGTQLEFSWSRQDDADPTPSEEPTTPAEAFEVIFAGLAARPFEARVSPSGVVVSLSGVMADAVAAKTGLLDVNAVGMFRPARLAAMLGPIFDAASLPMHRPQPWTSKRREALGRAGAVEIVTAWVPHVGDDSAVSAQGSITVRALEPTEASAGQPAVEIIRAQGNGELEWSPTTGLGLWSETLTLGTRWTIGDLTVGLSQRSERTVRRLPE